MPDTSADQPDTANDPNDPWAPHKTKHELNITVDQPSNSDGSLPA